VVGGSGANPHARHPGGPRARDPGPRAAPLLAHRGQLRGRLPFLWWHLVRPRLPRQRGSRRRARRSRLRRGPRERDRSGRRGAGGRGARDAQAEPRDGSAAIRPDQPAARGEPPLQLVGAAHPERGAALLRGAQAAHLPAHRLEGAAGRLPRHGGPSAAGVQRGGTVPDRGVAPARAGTPEHGAHLRRLQGLGPLRHHPDGAPAGGGPERRRRAALRPRGPALPGLLPSARRLEPGRTRDRGVGPLVPLALAHARRAGLARRRRRDRAGRPGTARAGSRPGRGERHRGAQPRGRDTARGDAAAAARQRGASARRACSR
jgi:hypothetical protein